MLKRAWHWVKEHPLIIVLGLGVILLLWLVSHGSNQQSSAVVAGGAAGPSDAAINAAAGLQAAALQADVSNNQIAASITAKANDNATALAIAQVQSQTAEYSTNLGAQVQLGGIQAQQNIQLAGIQSQVQLADISRLNTQDQINASVAISALNNATIASITNSQAERDTAQFQAQVDIATAPYVTVQKLYETLGSDALTKLVYGAEGTKGSVLQIPGISAGRVGSAGGSLFGNNFGNSNAGSVISNVLQQWGYGFQTGRGLLAI